MRLRFRAADWGKHGFRGRADRADVGRIETARDNAAKDRNQLDQVYRGGRSCLRHQSETDSSIDGCERRAGNALDRLLGEFGSYDHARVLHQICCGASD
jgi:hypothetical protein